MTLQYNTVTSLVTTHWLAENLEDPNLVILDASQASNANDTQMESNRTFIPNARHFDLKNKFSDKASDLPATLPSAEAFQEACQALGINSESKIIVYDNLGIYYSPRVWWMFRIMGHEQVSVLDGGLPQWLRDGYHSVEKTSTIAHRGNLKAQIRKDHVTDMYDVLNNLTDEQFILIDARSEGRFAGTMPEPRHGLPSGHIPKSINIPFSKVLEDGKYLTLENLRSLFQSPGLRQQHMVFSCGSGVTACIVLLAVEMVLDCQVSLYDGSWTEWAQHQPGLVVSTASK